MNCIYGCSNTRIFIALFLGILIALLVRKFISNRIINIYLKY